MALWGEDRRAEKLESLLGEATEALASGASDEARQRLRLWIADVVEPGGLDEDLTRRALAMLRRLDPVADRLRSAVERFERSLSPCPSCGAEVFIVLTEAAIDGLVCAGAKGPFPVDLVACEGCGRVELFAREPQRLRDHPDWSRRCETVRLKDRGGTPYR